MKMILIHMEGGLDRSTLSVPLEYERKESSIRYYIENGDFITNSNNKITPNNVVEKLQNKLANEFALRIREEKVSIKDLKMLVYMTDTDACFNSSNSTLLNKSSCLKELTSISSMKIKGVEIPFRVILLSTNLEVVLYGIDYSSYKTKEANLAKIKCAMDFSIKCKTNPLYLREVLRNTEIQKWQNYDSFKSTYSTCSNRATNLNLLIDNKL